MSTVEEIEAYRQAALRWYNEGRISDIAYVMRKVDELRAQVEAQAAVVKAAQEWARRHKGWCYGLSSTEDELALEDAEDTLVAAVAALEAQS